MFPKVKVRLCFYVAVCIQKYVQTSGCRLMFFFQFSCVPLVYYQGNTIYTLRARQNGRYFPDDIFKCIFWNGNVWIPMKSSLKFVPKGPINNKKTLKIKKTLKQIQTKQNRSIKALYNLDHLTPTKQMHKDLKLLMVYDLKLLMVEDIKRKINTLKFVHNQRNNKTPIVFKNYFIENRAIHQHNTRQTKDLHNTHANSNKKQQLIKRRGTKLWNQLPQSIRMPGGTLKTFTKHVKDRIISSYN